MTATAKKKCFVSERKVTPYGQSKGLVRYPLKICGDLRLPYDPCADPENFLRGGGGSKFPEGVLRKISIWQKLIIWQLLPGGGGGGGGGGERSGPPVTPSGSAHAIGLRIRIGTSTKGRFRNRTMPIRYEL